MQVFIVLSITAGFALILAILLGFLLGLFRDLFAIERDPLILKVREALPGANCGACGFPGCDGYAEAVAGGAAIDKCSTGGKAVLEALEALTGRTGSAEDRVSVLRCRGTHEAARLRGAYSGSPSCAAAKISSGGTKACPWGCVGFGDCVDACAFGALSMGKDGLPRIDHGLCTGCGMCASSCPQGLFELLPRARTGAVPLCKNQAQVKQTVAKACSNGCIKCELCVRACPIGAIRMEGGLPVVDYGRCDSCGVCVQKCPTGVLRLLEELRAGKDPAKKPAKATAAAEE